MVALAVASTFIFGGLAVGALTSGVVWAFGGLAFLFDLSEEIASGAMDTEGDKKRHTLTLARPQRTEIRTARFSFVACTICCFKFGSILDRMVRLRLFGGDIGCGCGDCLFRF